MESLRELYKVGNGPSSSHTMGPARAAKVFMGRYPEATSYEAVLYGSLAATGEGHLTDYIIIKTMDPKPVKITWRPEDFRPFHPNAMQFIAYNEANEEIGTWTVYSVGGGSIIEEGQARDEVESVYPNTTMNEVLDVCKEKNWTLADYVYAYEPDIKPYPTEGIKSKYKKTETGNPANNGLTDIDIKDNVIDDETDQDYIKDLTDLDKLNNGEWVDTREEADTHEINEYSSEDYYFEDFNKQNNYADNAPGGIFGAEARNKIVEKAKEIVELHKAGKAGYSQGTPSGNRTVDDEKRVVGGNAYLSNIFVYDCSSLVSCCYKHAGLTSMYNKNTYAQIEQVVANKGQMWLANSEGLKNALPGDLIYTTEGKMPVSQAMMGKYIPTQHVLIYIGDNTIKAMPESIKSNNLLKQNSWKVVHLIYKLLVPSIHHYLLFCLFLKILFSF